VVKIKDVFTSYIEVQIDVRKVRLEGLICVSMKSGAMSPQAEK
jgi:hypothetical protein